MKKFILLIFLMSALAPAPSEAGIFSRLVRVGSALNDRTKSESFFYGGLACGYLFFVSQPLFLHMRVFHLIDRNNRKKAAAEERLKSRIQKS